MRPLRVALAVIGMSASTPSAPAAARASPLATTCRMHAPEAAVRSGVAIDVVLRVMRAESGGNAGVVSVKGAVGCMQIMPATWRYLSRRYGLGADPYNARMNMIGGALFLAELAHRFGLPGAYAAYSAGPTRYIRHVAGGVPLPTETVTYVARVGGAGVPAVAASPHARWQEARLFLTGAGDLRDGGTPPHAVTVPTLFPLTENAAPVGR